MHTNPICCQRGGDWDEFINDKFSEECNKNNELDIKCKEDICKKIVLILFIILNELRLY